MRPLLKEMLVLSDIDGTLLTDSLELLPCNLESIRLFTALGGHFTVATGRTVESVSRYPQLLEFLSPIIACGGSVVYDFKKDEALVSHHLPRMIARRAMLDILQAVPRVGVVVVGSDGRNYQVAGRPETQRYYDGEHLAAFLRPPADLPADWNKILFCGSAEMIDKAKVVADERSYPGIYMVATSRVYLELMPQGVNKGSTLHELCELMDIPLENTTILGDYLNDLEIMQEAGHAVAMKNAPAEVRMAADEVCGANNDGGVGQYLYSLIRQYG